VCVCVCVCGSFCFCLFVSLWVMLPEIKWMMMMMMMTVLWRVVYKTVVHSYIRHIMLAFIVRARYGIKSYIVVNGHSRISVPNSVKFCQHDDRHKFITLSVHHCVQHTGLLQHIARLQLHRLGINYIWPLNILQIDWHAQQFLSDVIMVCYPFSPHTRR